MAKKIAKIIDWILGLNGCLMIATATLQIVSRIIGRPVAWTVELLTFLGLFSIIPGVAAHFLKNTETRVGIIVDHLPRTLRRLSEFVINAVCTVFGFILLYATYDYTGLVGWGRPNSSFPFLPRPTCCPSIC